MRIVLLGGGVYIDDFGATFSAKDKRLPAAVWFFLRDVLALHLHEEKWDQDCRLLFLGMHVTFSRTGLVILPLPPSLSVYVCGPSGCSPTGPVAKWCPEC